MHRRFIDANLTDSRPATLIMPRKYLSDLHVRIIAQFPGVNRFVLKVPDKERGEGVIIVSRKELNAYLKILLCSDECISQAQIDFSNYIIKKTGTSFSSIPEKIMHIHSWRNSDESEFMVEAYINSKPIKKGMDLFDGTMRVAFILVREESDFRFIPLGAYWKLPPKPIIENSVLGESCVSSFSEDHRLSALPDSEDEKEVFKQLNELLPRLFESILRFDVEDYIGQFPQNTNEERRSKSTQWLKLSNDYIKQGQLVFGYQYLELAKNLAPTNNSYYHQLGIYHHANRNYDGVINAFDRAIEENPKNPATYFRKGCSWLKKNNLHFAIQDFKKASELNPAYTAITQYILDRYSSENEEKQSMRPYKS